VIDPHTLAVALTSVVIVTAALAGLIGGIAGSLATRWVARRREQRSVADEAAAYLAQHTQEGRR